MCMYMGIQPNAIVSNFPIKLEMFSNLAELVNVYINCRKFRKLFE